MGYVDEKAELAASMPDVQMAERVLDIAILPVYYTGPWCGSLWGYTRKMDR